MFGKRNLPKVLHIILVSALLLSVALLMRGGLAGANVSMGAEVQGSRGAGEQSPISNTQSPTSKPSTGLRAGLQSPTSSRTITYAYDDAGRLVGADYGDGQGITYTYDEAGNLLQREVYGMATATPTPTSTPAPTPTPTPTVMVEVYLPMLFKGLP